MRERESDGARLDSHQVAVLGMLLIQLSGMVAHRLDADVVTHPDTLWSCRTHLLDHWSNIGRISSLLLTLLGSYQAPHSTVHQSPDNTSQTHLSPPVHQHLRLPPLPGRHVRHRQHRSSQWQYFDRPVCPSRDDGDVVNANNGGE